MLREWQIWQQRKPKRPVIEEVELNNLLWGKEIFQKTPYLTYPKVEPTLLLGNLVPVEILVLPITWAL